MFRHLVIAVAIVFITLAGCSKDNPKTNPVGTSVIDSTVFLGTLYDLVLAAMFTSLNMNYTGSQYRYAIKSDNTFKVDENIGMGWTSPSGEEGSYTVNGSTRTFIPAVDRHDDQTTHQMVPTDSLRPVYTGSLSNDSLTFADFINIENKADQRNLGTLVLKRQ
jgi:hypothetical protein